MVAYYIIYIDLKNHGKKIESKIIFEAKNFLKLPSAYPNGCNIKFFPIWPEVLARPFLYLLFFI